MLPNGNCVNQAQLNNPDLFYSGTSIGRVTQVSRCMKCTFMLQFWCSMF